MTSTIQRPILIVDDDPGMRATLTLSLRQMGHAVVAAANGVEALAQIEQHPVCAVVTDMAMPGMSGMDLFRTIKQRRPGIPVVFISAFGSIEVAVDAMKAGGFDYLAKPFSPEALTSVVCRALQTGIPLECALPAAGTGAILTRDPGMLKVLKMAQTVAASQATILIEGESGTGKELLARFIHERSPRAHRPFIAINCAAVPEGLMESELFGYEKGAFTGAVAKKPGRFELAHTGTLLLDEIGELPLSLQAKLLRVLQEREVDVLGGRKPVALDVRVIASTNRSLWDEVKAGRFREDLYYRLNVFPLRLPPLRHRPCDIPLLVEHFVQQGAVEHRRPALTVTPDAMAILMGREWRGNIRELGNVVERAVLLAEHGAITADHLLVPDRVNARPLSAFSTGTTVWEAERSLILDTLERAGDNRTHAARILGISIRTLRNKLHLYRGLSPSDDAPPLSREPAHDALLPAAAGEAADADQLWLPRVVGG